jgi:hypothetical protein
MCPAQDKTGRDSMVKRHRLPLTYLVATAAVRAIITLVDVIILMTGVAVGAGKAGEFYTAVTGLARQPIMATHQGKPGE